MSLKTVWYKVYDFKTHGSEPQEAGTVRTLNVEGKRVALAYQDKRYYALDDRCPHAGGKFGSGGWCEQMEMICPVHRHRFNLETGRSNMGDFIETYQTEIRDDGLYIGIPRKKRWWLF